MTFTLVAGQDGIDEEVKESGRMAAVQRFVMPRLTGRLCIDHRRFLRYIDCSVFGGRRRVTELRIRKLRNTYSASIGISPFLLYVVHAIIQNSGTKKTNVSSGSSMSSGSGVFVDGQHTKRS